MSVRIGHASKDERGRARGGESGDQTGKEVRIRNWYRGGWKMVLRAKDAAVAEKIAASCEAACRNDNMGYDQSGRNTALQEGQKVNWDLAAVDTPSEADCSSLVSMCVQAAGIDIWSGGNAPTTRTLEKVLTGTGAFEALKDEKYLTGTDHLLRGDILLNPGVHTVTVLDNGALAHREDAAAPEEPKNDIASAVTYSVTLPLVREGDKGRIVETVQTLLILRGCDPGNVDGKFGPKTKAAVIELQHKAGITEDGDVGGETWPVLVGIN